MKFMARISVAQKHRDMLKDSLLRPRMLLSRSPSYTAITLPWAGNRTSCVSLPSPVLSRTHVWHIQPANALQDIYPDPDIKRDSLSHPGLELPSIRESLQQDALSPYQSNRPRELLPSIFGQSPPGRYSSLPPIQRREKQRARKPSMGENARKGKHERTKSKELFPRRMTSEGRKAMSAEPPTAAWVQGKRWEDLIEAATSATEADDDRDLTPVSQMTFFDCPLFTCCCQEIEIL